ncbi:MAG: iron ABC transporter permease [Thermoanaerobaculia bacterium]|nr:iron ABC transporter permease [Thermoanaerobaculia bacterium]
MTRILGIPARWLAILIAAVFLSIGTAMMLGPELLGPGRLLDLVRPTTGDHPLDRLLLDWRLPRVLTAFLVGGLLGAAGAVFQGIFRNPLADPFLIGTAPGAALGATLALLVPGLPVFQAISPFLLLPVLSFLGAFGATLAVLLLARLAQVRDTAGLLLAGVAMAAFLGAVRSYLMLALADETISLQVVLSWTLGGIQTPFWREVGLVALLSLLLLLLAYGLAHGLDVLGLGDDVARNMNLPVERFVVMATLVASALVALAVTWGGTIGFVGLVVPHLMRWTVGPRHAPLIVASALVGGVLLTLLDGLARSLLPPAEIPLGLLTALVGAPFFMFILARRSHQ